MRVLNQDYMGGAIGGCFQRRSVAQGAQGAANEGIFRHPIGQLAERGPEQCIHGRPVDANGVRGDANVALVGVESHVAAHEGRKAHLAIADPLLGIGRPGLRNGSKEPAKSQFVGQIPSQDTERADGETCAIFLIHAPEINPGTRFAAGYTSRPSFVSASAAEIFPWRYWKMCSRTAPARI